MLISDHTLLLVIGFSGLCVGVTLLVTWFSVHAEPYLLTWAIGVGFLLFAAFGFALYGMSLSPVLGAISFGFVVIGFGIGLAAANQFCTGRLNLPAIAPGILLPLLAVVNAMLAGYNGLAIILAEASAAVLLALTAFVYWKARAEAPMTLTVLASLYLVTAAVFAMSCAVLVIDGNLELRLPPRNWAETLGRTVSIFTFMGIGALSLVLAHWRAARRKEQLALTDPATGLLNRRALFELYEQNAALAQSALIVFGLDDLTDIRTRFGPAADEQVIRSFVATLGREGGERGIVARLSGDEFAFVVMRSPSEMATGIAERVSSAFAAEPIPIGWDSLHCRISAGVAFTSTGGGAFEDVVRTARMALSAARRDGPNGVVTLPLQLAG